MDGYETIGLRLRRAKTHSATKKPAFDRVKEVVTFLLAITTFGFGIYQFIYVNIYLEAKRPATLTLSCKTEQVGMKDNLVAVQVTYTYHNTGKTRVYLLGSWCNIVGIDTNKIAPDDVAEDDEFSKGVADSLSRKQFADEDDVRVPRYWTESPGTVVYCAKLSGPSWMEADEEESGSFIVYVPSGEFDIVRAQTSVALTKNPDRLRLMLTDDGLGKMTAMSQTLVGGKWQPLPTPRTADGLSAANAQVSYLDTESELFLKNSENPSKS